MAPNVKSDKMGRKIDPRRMSVNKSIRTMRKQRSNRKDTDSLIISPERKIRDIDKRTMSRHPRLRGNVIKDYRQHRMDEIEAMDPIPEELFDEGNYYD